LMEPAPYSSSFFFFGAATIEQISSELAAERRAAARTINHSLPGRGDRTDSASAFLHT